LLTNAIKYTPDGGRITVSANRTTSGKVKIAVQDTGIGIPEAEQSKVFSAFERVDDEYANTQVGTGLGMPLTQRLAEVNGGTVGFDSVEGQGSTFWVLLTAVEVEPLAELSESEDGVFEGHGEGECILFVDNKDEMSELVERYMVKHGFEVVRASNGSEVLKQLRKHRIEVALVENDLAGFSGEEVVSCIRMTPHSASVPIILLSSRAFVFDIARYLQLGVDRCLSKPVALSEIAATVRRLIDEARTLEEHSTSGNHPVQPH
jgi:CheY-like chemotaxis protein